MTEPATNRRAPRPQAVLTVRRREWLSPHIVRITAGGDGGYGGHRFAEDSCDQFRVSRKTLLILRKGRAFAAGSGRN